MVVLFLILLEINIRLIAKFEYERKFVFVRFIGTHKDYDKIEDIAHI